MHLLKNSFSLSLADSWSLTWNCRVRGPHDAADTRSFVTLAQARLCDAGASLLSSAWYSQPIIELSLLSGQAATFL